jgi:hypothetical protein
METTAHFENIPQEIARRLAAATQEIVVAVAWFTDRDLFDLLCGQAGRGVRVRLAVLNDQINIGPGRLNFQRSSGSHAQRGSKSGRSGVAWLIGPLERPRLHSHAERGNEI